MDARDALALAGTGLWTHKLRSALATLGVILGIAAVISIVTLGAGLQQSIVGTFTHQFDSDLVEVGLRTQGPGPGGQPNLLAFTDRDIASIQNLTGVKEAGGFATLQSAQVAYRNTTVPGLLIQATSGPLLTSYDAGHPIAGPHEAVVNNRTATVFQNATKHAILGTTLQVREPQGNGSTRTTTVTVVGIVKDSIFQPGGVLYLPASYGPLVTVNGTVTHGWLGVIVRATDTTVVPQVADEIHAYLKGNSDAKTLIGPGVGFRVSTQQQVVSAINSGVSQFTTFIAAVGAVALLVGLVGIANIMLVSVQERTREIGVMKATGATRRDILGIFLAESVAICAAGAVVGIALGSILGLAAANIASRFLASDLNIPFVFVPSWYAIAVVLGILVGVLAGIYPAWRAGRVDPVEALRYE